jgi:alkylhydroperoxidase/carboxymuconolactone decarboxylase family protein YurZ
MADATHFYPHSKVIHEFLGRDRPEFLRRYLDLSGAALLHRDRTDEVGLSARYRELVVLGILAFRGASEESMAGHIKRALDLGASRAEILGTFECAVIPGGAPTMLNGLRALKWLEDHQEPDGPRPAENREAGSASHD